MNIFHKLHLFNDLINNERVNSRHKEDIYCLQLLQPILNAGGFIPFTSMALRPYVLSFLLNELTVNSRKRVIEFGAGISTLMMARTVHKNNLDVSIVSIDESADWLKVVSEMLEKEHLSRFVKLIHSNTEDRVVKESTNHWYRQDDLNKELKGCQPFDLVMIDGPTACNKDIAMSRYFALPFLKNMLAERHIIMLDDANRDGEQEIMRMWKQESGMKFSMYAETLGVAYQGSHFESNPMKSVIVKPIK